MKTPTDILNRGVINIIKKEEVEQALVNSGPLRIKHGIDPSSNEIHLGYAVIYRKLRKLQELGHTIIFLIGDFTARFGDPTGKLQTRIMRDAGEVRKQADSYVKQITKILDPKKLEVRYNSEWYDKLKTEEIFSILANFTTAQMLERDMFRERIKNNKEIFLHELLYPVLQGYDSVMLKSDLTVIGSDQIFNEMIGRDLQRIYGQKPQGIIAMEVLPGTDGTRKMSQSYNNTIGINESADMQYGKIMSMPDNTIVTYLELLTDLPEKEIKNIKEEMTDGKLNPKSAKEKLALDIISWLHGKKEAEEAKEEFDHVFSDKKLPTKAPELITQKNEERPVVEWLVIAGLTASTSAGRRLIEQKAVKIEGEIVMDIRQKEIIDKPKIIQAGRKSVRIAPQDK